MTPTTPLGTPTPPGTPRPSWRAQTSPGDSQTLRDLQLPGNINTPQEPPGTVSSPRDSAPTLDSNTPLGPQLLARHPPFLMRDPQRGIFPYHVQVGTPFNSPWIPRTRNPRAS